MSEPRPIVVGVDGSPSSLAALDYAAALAERRGAPLHLVHGYQHPMYSYDIIGLPLPSEPTEDNVREQVQDLLRDLVWRLCRQHPRLVDARAWQIDASPATVLTKVDFHRLKDAEDLLADEAKVWAAKYPELSIEMRAERGEHPGHTLIQMSRDAALTVVGCRGLGGFTGLLLGSVSGALVHHAHGPVAVIHPAEHREEEES